MSGASLKGFRTKLRARDGYGAGEGPKYRRIHPYFKSWKQYSKEWHRRTQARLLSDQGYTYLQIAEKLGVSARTVQRDMNKTKSYRRGQLNKILRAFQEEQRRALQAQMEGMTPLEQFKFVTNKLIEYQQRLKARTYHKRTLTLTIHLDDILRGLDGQPYGRPFITFSPKAMNCCLTELRLQVRFKMEGQNIPYALLTFS